MYRLSDLISSDELYHHGIKGQKWGRRRFQNEDGSLTPAGKERYDDDAPNNPSRPKHRDKLIAKYQSEGLSRENAQYMADRRIKTEKIVAGAAAVTVVAATAYIANKQLRGRIDKVIKQGTEIQRISADVDQPLMSKKALYVAYDKNDKIKYKGNFAKAQSDFNIKLNNVTYKNTSKLRIPSAKKAEETFINLYKNDKDFKKSFIKNLEQMDHDGRIPDDLSKVVKEFLKVGKSNLGSAETMSYMQDKKLMENSSMLYRAFNNGLVMTKGDAGIVANKFYGELKNMGYDGVTDLMDKYDPRFKSKNPTIVFNTTKMAIEKVEELKKDVINENYMKSREILKGQAKAEEILSYMKENGKTLASITGASTGLIGAKNLSDTKLISKYRREHPNTRLSDKEILRMLQQEKKK